MGRLLVHVATGPESATGAALGLLVARTAPAAGRQVDRFVAGDAVGLLRPSTLDAGADPDQVGDVPVQFAPPDVLVSLAFEADRVLSS